jgi:hypothetical protein
MNQIQLEGKRKNQMEIDHAKRVQEFVETSKATKTWNTNVCFVLVGSPYPNAPVKL